MGAELLEKGQFPWDLPDARRFHEAVSGAISAPDEIDRLYKSCGAGLKALDKSGGAADIWKRALEKLAAAGLLRCLGGLVIQDRALAAIHPPTQCFVNLIDRPPIIKPLSEALTGNAYESLTRIRSAMPQHIDSAFIALQLVRRVEIDRPNARLETEETLLNVSDETMNRVVRLVVTDSPTEFEDLQMVAKVEVPGEPPFIAPLKPDVSEDRKQFRITLTFNGRVVAKLGTVTVRWQCVVPASVARYEDYWVFPHSFSAPTKQSTIEALFDREPEDINLYRDDYKWLQQREHLTPIGMKERREETAEKGRRFVYGVELTNNDGTFMFTWRFRK